jgi:hypothetical protein
MGWRGPEAPGRGSRRLLPVPWSTPAAPCAQPHRHGSAAQAPLRRCASGRSSTEVLGLRSSALDLSPDEDKVLGHPPQLFVVQFGEEPRRRRSSARAIARAATWANVSSCSPCGRRARPGSDRRGRCGGSFDSTPRSNRVAILWLGGMRWGTWSQNGPNLCCVICWPPDLCSSDPIFSWSG